MTSRPTQTQIVFDANCVLCSGMVKFVLARERDHNITFINAWSETGLALGETHGLTKDDLNSTFLLVRDGVGLTHSAAALAILDHLKQPWRLLKIAKLIPRFIRDSLYKTIAKNRYRWFGFEEYCVVIPPDQKHRFVDSSPLAK